MGVRGSKAKPEVPLTSPIAFRACSNGEYSPPPPTPRDLRAEHRFLEIVEEKHKRLGITRRAFAESACGVAAALLVINEVYGCSDGEGQGGGGASGASGGSAGAGAGGRDAGGAGGAGRSSTNTMDGGSAGMRADAGLPSMDDAGFGVTDAMTEDAAMACAALEGDEFVFDVQMHPPNPLSPWTGRPLAMDAETFIRTAFVDSETTMGVLSGIPSTRELGLPNVEANRMLQELIDRLAGRRLIFHANLRPNLGPSELDYMAQVVEQFDIAAWKVYPHEGSWRLDSDEVGLPFVAKARELGVRIIAAHRGIAGDAGDYGAPSSPVDLVQAAAAFPDVTFLTYHSGWQDNVDENHPFDPNQANPRGIDRLIKAVIDADIGPAGNVYAELGSTWRNLMTQPEAAAHALGKLLLHLGEDRVVWGTDSVFTGSPTEQIVAFRMFQIPERMQEEFGYPALTDAIKRKVFGLNAAPVYGVDPDQRRCAIAGDFVEQARMARKHDREAFAVPSEKAYGPRTRREFLAWERFCKAFNLA